MSLSRSDTPLGRFVSLHTRFTAHSMCDCIALVSFRSLSSPRCSRRELLRLRANDAGKKEILYCRFSVARGANRHTIDVQTSTRMPPLPLPCQLTTFAAFRAGKGERRRERAKKSSKFPSLRDSNGGAHRARLDFYERQIRDYSSFIQ